MKRAVFERLRACAGLLVAACAVLAGGEGLARADGAATRPAIVTIDAGEPLANGAPVWAVMERDLIDLMNRAAPVLLAKCTRPDGELLWPAKAGVKTIDCHGLFEGFHAWPLFYLLGGDDKILQAFYKEFDCAVKQGSAIDTGHGYPALVKEFEASYDWFHLGEGYYGFRMACMADPANPKTVERATRLAGFYLNEDPDAINYDPNLKIIRCIFNGSKGPGFGLFEGDNIWAPTGYGLPYYDVDGCKRVEDLADANVGKRMAQITRDRRSKGDVPQNLAVTSIVTEAFLLTGQEKYRSWVKEYVGAWIERAKENGGIIPDNVGLSGKVGEYIDGKWYGGHYGWTWAHGVENIGQVTVAAAENAALLTGDANYMQFPRGQMDILMSKGIEKDGTLYVPYKYGDPGKVCYEPWPWLQVLRNADKTALQQDGWFEFKPMGPHFLAHVWAMSMDANDMGRAKTIRNAQTKNWQTARGYQEKDGGGNDAAWMAYLNGEFPAYPEEILKYELSAVYAAVNRLEKEKPLELTDDFHYVLLRNPIFNEALVQLTLGGPMPIYNGGLLVARLRYFDAQRRRPGLPADVGALVSKLTANGAVVTLVNLSFDQDREVIIQAGAMGEHRFTEVKFRGMIDGKMQGQTVKVEGKFLRVHLAPLSETTLDLGMKRLAGEPSYRLPWE